MELNIKQSFEYAFQTKKWLTNYFVLFGLIALYYLLLLMHVINDNDGKLATLSFFASYIPLIIYWGIFSCLTNTRILKPESNSISFNFNKASLAGLKWIGFGAILGIIIFISVLIFVPVAVLVFSNAFSNANAGIWITFGITFLYYFLLITAVLLYTDIAFLAFSVDLRFSSFFELKKFKVILIDNFKDYVVFSLLRLGIGIILFFANILTLGLTSPLSTFVLADLNAQFMRKILKLETKQV